MSVTTRGIKRRERRVALRLPVRLELEAGPGPPAVVEGWAEDLSGHGFRFRPDGGEVPGPLGLERPYPAEVTIGRKTLSTVVEFVWCAGGCWGVRLWQRDRAWPVG